MGMNNRQRLAAEAIDNCIVPFPVSHAVLSIIVAES